MNERWAEASTSQGGWDSKQIDRKLAWLHLLQVSVDAVEQDESSSAMLPSRAMLPPHPDEAQVVLDVKRSFGLYKQTKEESVMKVRRQQLQAVIQGTLRKYPSLHYYQGFHDIASVLLLTLSPTLPEEGETWPSIEDQHFVQRSLDKISLHVVRDSMSSNMDPILGQLKIVRNLVRAADLPFALAIERAFGQSQILVALPWVLTLLMHEVGELHSAQCIMDFVLSYGPASIHYLCATLILWHKESLADMATKQGGRPIEHLDMAQVHHTLAKIPPLDTDKSRSALLTQARQMLHTYPLHCPAVHAHTILASSSVLFTDSPFCSDAESLRYAALPGSAHALDIAATPQADHDQVNEKFIPVARVPRVLLLQRMLPFLSRRNSAHFIMATWLSLFFGGSVLSVLLAAQLASYP
ncbi:GTPase-activating protein gyp8 [Malassezia psittaci]|uniref:GTPase-activating protein gyp8 n=1 Tax=Malassezia psittaci TaxID=1821823 RepID=A0AAF0F7N9_9BASI|nr:GTPase-activating protein gyp8 [Malassezia psittaci]